ncbi:hypothetical protein O9992_24070 [Vibrio lentus]|nr:hypothetical protein [Vibrio lentus]
MATSSVSNLSVKEAGECNIGFVFTYRHKAFQDGRGLPFSAINSFNVAICSSDK